MVCKYFDKKPSRGTVKSKIILNQVIENLTKEKYTHRLQTIFEVLI